MWASGNSLTIQRRLTEPLRTQRTFKKRLEKKKLRQGGTLGDFICLANMRLYIKTKKTKKKKSLEPDQTK